MTKKSEPFAPRRVSDEVKVLTITGHLIPWGIEQEQPLMFGMPETPDLFIPFFSTIEKLEAFCARHAKEITYKIKQIDDGPEMLSSLPYWIEPDVRLRVMVDPWMTETGTLRFQEIVRSDA